MYSNATAPLALGDTNSNSLHLIQVKTSYRIVFDYFIISMFPTFCPCTTTLISFRNSMFILLHLNFSYLPTAHRCSILYILP